MRLRNCIVCLVCAVVLIAGCASAPPMPSEDPGEGYVWNYNEDDKAWERITEAQAEEIRQQEEAERLAEEERLREQKERAAQLTETDISGLFASAADLEGSRVRFSVDGPLRVTSGGKGTIVPSEGRMLKMELCTSTFNVRDMQEDYGLEAVEYEKEDIEGFNQARSYTVHALVVDSGKTNYISLGENDIPSGQYNFVKLEVLSIE